jgi:thiol-disulfide isomerase/thioredoxin
VRSVSVENAEDGWWTHGLNDPGVITINSTPAFLDTLAAAGDKLVVVHIYAHWCGACKALHPKVSSLLRERSDTVVHALLEYDSQKALAKRLGVKVLPFFQLYRGASGKLREFSCTVTKVQLLKDALAELDGTR